MADAKPHGKCKVCGSALMRAHEHWMKEPTIICLPCEQKDRQELTLRNMEAKSRSSR